MPAGFNTRHISRIIASNCASSRAKCRTALLSTTSAKPSPTHECCIDSIPETALALLAAFVAVTCDRILEPTSALVST